MFLQMNAAIFTLCFLVASMLYSGLCFKLYRVNERYFPDEAQLEPPFMSDIINEEDVYPSRDEYSQILPYLKVWNRDIKRQYDDRHGRSFHKATKRDSIIINPASMANAEYINCISLCNQCKVKLSLEISALCYNQCSNGKEHWSYSACLTASIIMKNSKGR